MSTSGPLFPVGLVVAGRRCLVVGGGRIAARKVAQLVACGADVTVVAPDVVPLAGRPARGRRRSAAATGAGEAAGYRLVITATGDPAVDQAVFDDAEAAGVWVNAADDPARCSFTLPAVTRQGPVTVAVATDGTSPALAAWLRDRLAARPARRPRPARGGGRPASATTCTRPAAPPRAWPGPS